MNQLLNEENRAKTETERAWLDAYFAFCRINRSDEEKREIMITPFEGHYGYAGVVVAINGSPMRGTMLVKSHDIKDPAAEKTLGGRIDHMYVLHSGYAPKKLHDPDSYYSKSQSKQIVLWRAMKNLLIERGFLSA